MQVISLGAGVQSTTLYLMSCYGDLPRADYAIFADTGWEPQSVYDHLERLKALNEIEIITVSNGNIRKDAAAGGRFASMPFYLKGGDGKRGILRRQCTNEYKIKPLSKKLRELGATARNPFEVWIGISTDEIHRMKDSRVKYTNHSWPLIDMRMDRRQCRRWLEEHWPEKVPKSACIGCPFRRDSTWKELTQGEFEDAAQFEAGVQGSMSERLGKVPYLHDSLVPLREAVLSEEDQLDMFGNECEGMCGV